MTYDLFERVGLYSEKGQPKTTVSDWKNDLPPNRATTAEEANQEWEEKRKSNFVLEVGCPTCGALPQDRCQWPRNVGKDMALLFCDSHRSRVGLALDRGYDTPYGYVPNYPPPSPEGLENKIY